ncbi:MAG: site-specific integrase, partial [Pseudomonadota bacterium]|nr:site-specific integrase [Pseudomonadota bacterium]
MATIQKRGDKYRVRVRKQGQGTVCKTFNLKKDAEAWARKVESEMERGLYLDIQEAQRVTVAEAID